MIGDLVARAPNADVLFLEPQPSTILDQGLGIFYIRCICIGIHTYIATCIHTMYVLSVCVCMYVIHTHTYRQADGRKEGQTDRQTDRQTYVHTCIVLIACFIVLHNCGV